MQPSSSLNSRPGRSPPPILVPRRCHAPHVCDLYFTMMVQALLLLPRLVVTPPARLLLVPPHRASIRRFTAPGVQLGEDGGRQARGAEQLLAAMSNAKARGGSVQMATRDSDREVVLAAVQQNGDALYYASTELQADREIVLAAVQQYGDALKHASAELRADRNFVLAAVQQYGRALSWASAELQADREVVLAAVQQDGGALYWASAELRADREVALAAVQKNGGALEHASAELQRDDALLKAANHMFGDLDRLADHGQLKVLRTLASVRECGRQMDNCLAKYDLVQCGRQILVKLDGDDGIPLAVGSFANGEWEEIRYANNRDARGGGNRACARDSAAALPPANIEDALDRFDAYLPALQAFRLKTRVSKVIVWAMSSLRSSLWSTAPC